MIQCIQRRDLDNIIVDKEKMHIQDINTLEFVYKSDQLNPIYRHDSFSPVNKALLRMWKKFGKFPYVKSK